MRKKEPTTNSQQLGNLIERYKKIIKPPQSSVTKEVTLAIKDCTGIDVHPKDLEFAVASKTLYIKTPSIIKSEVLKHQDALTKILTERLGEHNAPQRFL